MHISALSWLEGDMFKLILRQNLEEKKLQKLTSACQMATPYTKASPLGASFCISIVIQLLHVVGRIEEITGRVL